VKPFHRFGTTASPGLATAALDKEIRAQAFAKGVKPLAFLSIWPVTAYSTLQTLSTSPMTSFLI
jgi:hypothetical protein